ncbi:hypothetical protein OCJ37_16380 [Xanthomonas sp. AM6]|uniref:hypothetical protein n=1 Tax=Xanthomonas sp. AM6 TaxID=2982531 RepID=UPI0021DADD5C|nr:hypothetical protein [Xanthomonas sp. AM6]UYB51533.1 hypothetical protein OCJ37_16380 [Xanthomonas sp. AM6]
MPDQAYDLPLARFDETAQRLAHATGCGIVYDDPSLSSMRVDAVRGRIGIRQANRRARGDTAIRIAQEIADTIGVGPR